MGRDLPATPRRQREAMGGTGDDLGEGRELRAHGVTFGAGVIPTPSRGPTEAHPDPFFRRPIRQEVSPQVRWTEVPD